MALSARVWRKKSFLSSGPKVPFSLPAPDRECCIFSLTRQKNRILSMGANKECHSLLLLPRCVIYYFAQCANVREFRGNSRARLIPEI